MAKNPDYHKISKNPPKVHRILVEIQSFSHWDWLHLVMVSGSTIRLWKHNLPNLSQIAMEDSFKKG